MARLFISDAKAFLEGIFGERRGTGDAGWGGGECAMRKRGLVASFQALTQILQRQEQEALAPWYT